MFDWLKKFWPAAKPQAAPQRRNFPPPKQGAAATPTPASAEAYEIPWLSPEQNRWGGRVLHIAPITQTLLLTSTNKQCAENSVSFGQEDGLAFTSAPMPEGSLPVDLAFASDPLLADGALFIPNCMEHKWAIYHHAHRLYFVRSWTREVQAVAELEATGHQVRVVRLHGRIDPEAADPAANEQALDFLLRSHALGEVLPAPFPARLVDEPKQAALYCMSLYGKIALIATPDALPRTVPQKPLRSYSLLHMATARGQLARMAELLDQGMPVDLPDPDGSTLVHWAMAQQERAVFQLLVDRGADLNAARPDGTTPLMAATQDGAEEALEWLLEAGAAANLGDARGFTALHRASEIGNARQVAILMKHGASPTIEAHGHTPISLAEAAGHAEVVALLRGSGKP